MISWPAELTGTYVPETLTSSFMHTKRKQRRSRGITWSDSVTLYHSTECGNPQAEIIAIRDSEKQTRSNLTRRCTFRCEAEAIISQRRKKRDQLMSHLESLLPALAKLQWSHLSLREMEAVECDIIEELDSLRQMHATIGNPQNSSEYNLMEKQFALLLEAYECFFKLSCADNQLKEAASIKTRNRIRIPSLRLSLLFKKCVSVHVDCDAESW